MQFSESGSSDSSAAPTPVRHLQKALPQHLSGGDNKNNVEPDGLDSTVRAFASTTYVGADVAKANKEGSYGGNKSDSSDSGDDALRGSSLKISATAGTQGSPMTAATRAKTFIPVSDDSTDDNGNKACGAGGHSRGGSVPASQQAPPFFAQMTATTANNAVVTGVITPGERLNVKSFRLAQSSSSSASSLSLELPSLNRTTKQATTTGSARKPSQGRSAPLPSTSSLSVASSRGSSPVVARNAARSPSSSSSASSTSDIVLHRLTVPPGSTAALVPAKTSQKQQQHLVKAASSSRGDLRAILEGPLVTPVAATASAAAPLQPLMNSATVFPKAASTLADTSRTTTTAFETSFTMASPECLPRGTKKSPRPSVSPLSASAAQAVVNASTASDTSLITTTATTNSEASAPPLPQVLRRTSQAPLQPPYLSTVLSDLEDDVGDDTLDSSAASLAAQAALDAAEQRSHAETSPAVPASVLHSLSVPPSQGLQSLVPPSQPDAPLSSVQQQQTPLQLPVPAGEKKKRAEGSTGALPVETPVHTTSGEHETHLDDTDDATVESRVAGSLPQLHDTEAAEGIVAGPRRQPPPPPALSTNATVTQPSHSAVPPDDGVSARSECDQEENYDGMELSLSKEETELTIEQQNAPTTHGTFTQATSIEAAQGVVVHSASLLPPTRSSSTSGSSNGSRRSSNDNGDGVCCQKVKRHPLHHKRLNPKAANNNRSSSSGSSSGADTPALSPPHRAMECSGTLEEDEGGTLRSVLTIGGVAAPVAHGVPSTMDLKHQQLQHLPSLHGETHGETQTAALATTAATGDESLSRLSGMLMPPSPSQPRVSLSPRAASLDSSNASSSVRAKTRRNSGGVAVTLPPPTPPQMEKEQENSSASERLIDGAVTSAAIDGNGKMRTAPAPSLSSSSSSPSPNNDRVDRRHGVHQCGGNDSCRKVTVGDSNTSGSGSWSNGSSGVAKAAVGHGPHIRVMPIISSSDSDDENEAVNEMANHDEEVARNAAALHRTSKGSRSMSSSAALEEAAGEESEHRSARVKKMLQAYGFGGHSADAEQAQNETWSDAESGHEGEEIGGETQKAAEQYEDDGGKAGYETMDEWGIVDEEDEENSVAAALTSDADADSPSELQETGRWNEVLKGMELIDCTLVSRVYQQTVSRRTRESYSNADENEEAGKDVCLFKVLSLFPVVATGERARWSRRTAVQRRLLDLAQAMRDTQQALDDAGLTAAGLEQNLSASLDDVDRPRPTRVTCAGISAVYVDASCRLIAQLEAEPYMVPLRHLVPAVCSTGLQESEIIALLRSVVSKTAAMHNAGFVHGALHAGNVLFSSYDGDTILTQPAGLMSQSMTLPSDLSVLSVARACAMASHLPKVWGLRRLHVATQNSSRLGTPPRPDINELITYHNLAALGWERDEVEGEDESEVDCLRSSSQMAYTPTPADDLYALGMIAFLLYFGVPAFHMTSLWTAVERLGVLAGDYEAAVASSSRREARRHIAAFCFGEHRTRRRSGRAENDDSASAAALQLPDMFTCNYGNLQRHVAGRLRPKFEQALQDFIVDCVEASCMDAVSEGGATMTFSHVEKGGVDKDCENSGGPHYRTAQDLLGAHVLFQQFGTAVDDDDAADGEAADEQMRDTVHRVVYPAFCTWAQARRECGSTPHLARMYSNALYTARCTALCESLEASNAAAGVTAEPCQLRNTQERFGESTRRTQHTVLSALCPEVAGDLQAWKPLFPSVESNESGGHCMYGASADEKEENEKIATAIKLEKETEADSKSPQHLRRAHARLDRSTTQAVAAREDVSSFIQPSDVAAPAWLTRGLEDEYEDGAVDENMLVTQLLQDPPHSACDFTHYPHLHALVLANRERDAYALSRAFISRLSYAMDTLVLQHLQDCTVTLLAPFRYVVLDDVTRCEIRLGPCEMCVLQDVQNCPFVAVAAHHIAGQRVFDSHLSWSGQGGRTPRLDDSHGVSLSLYGLVYSGLTEDYKRVGLPLEHAASLCTVTDSVNGREVQQRSFELMSTAASVRTQNEISLCLTPEAPYAHAILAVGTRFVHRGSAVLSPSSKVVLDEEQPSKMEDNDVYHYYGELCEKDVLICDLHGSREGELPGVTVSRPIVFIHDVLGDVTIQHCSYCTIAVAGSPSSLQVLDCHHCQLIIMARESVLERCTQVDCVALVTEYLLLRSCAEVRVRPLFLDCPYSDAVLRSVVMGSLGGQEEEAVVSAYEAGRLDLLNAVLRGVGRGVNVEDSTQVVVEDMLYYHQNDNNNDNSGNSPQNAVEEKWFSVFTVPYNSHSCRVRRVGAGGEGEDDQEQEHSAASQIMAEAAQELAEHLLLPVYTELLQRYEDAADATPAAEQQTLQHTVAFHDLLDCSILRLRGALCPVRTAEQVCAEAAGGELPDKPLTDLCIERVQFGVLYIEDAVRTLSLWHCVGPLDVVVCAATTVVMEDCVGVQLRAACVDFRATNCVGCHVALHVNHRPQYERCTSIETSALNITSSDYDVLLASAGVNLEVNCFHSPLLLTPTWRSTETTDAPAPALTARAIHAYCSGAKAAAPDSRTAADLFSSLRSLLSSPDGQQGNHGFKVPPEQTPLIMALLRQPVTVVAPLPGLCVGPQQAPLLRELETLVAQWSCELLPACRTDVVVLALRAVADVSSVYLNVPEWTTTAATEAEAVAEGSEEKRPSSKSLVFDDATEGVVIEEPAETMELQEKMQGEQQQQPAEEVVLSLITVDNEREEVEVAAATQPTSVEGAAVTVAYPVVPATADPATKEAKSETSSTASEKTEAHKKEAVVRLPKDESVSTEAHEEIEVDCADEKDKPQQIHAVAGHYTHYKAESEEGVVTIYTAQSEENEQDKADGLVVEEVVHVQAVEEREAEEDETVEVKGSSSFIVEDVKVEDAVETPKKDEVDVIAEGMIDKEEEKQPKVAGFAVEELEDGDPKEQHDDAEIPHVDEMLLLGATSAGSGTHRARSTSDSGAVFVVSPPSPSGEQDHDETGLELLGVEDVTPVVVIATSMYRDPEATLHDPAHVVQPSVHISDGSFALSRYSHPLPSQSPLSTSLDPSAPSDRDNCTFVNALHAATATIGASIVDVSVGSSVGMPPMAPGPAYALAATDVGASATMDVFNRTYPSAVIAAAIAAAIGPFDMADVPARQAAMVEEVEDGPVHVHDSPSDPRPTLAGASPATTAPFVAVRDGAMEQLQLGTPPLKATINSFPRDSNEDWARSPRVDSPNSTDNDSSGSSRDGDDGTVSIRQPTENAPTLAAAAALGSVPRSVSDVVKFFTSAPAPALETHGATEDIIDFSRQTSSSVSDYPHRGVQACTDSAARDTGVEDNDTRRMDGTRQATNFLHFSQDSSSRRGEYSLPLSHLAVNGMSPLVSPGDHRTTGSGSFPVPVPTAAEGFTTHNVDAGLRELLRQVEEARQRYQRRQLLQQQQPVMRSTEGLEARVKSAVAKLKAMRATKEVA